MNTLNPSENISSDQPQVEKLQERLLAAARKSGVTSHQFQVALAYPGVELENEIVAQIVRFAKKAGNIVTPLRAQDTGLVPNGWKVLSDSPEGDINITNLNYFSCPVLPGEPSVRGDIMLSRAGNAYGSLGFVAVLLRAQAEGKKIFPIESRGNHCFIMPRTVLSDEGHYRHMPCFYWMSEHWVFNFAWLDNDFYDDYRFVRSRDLSLAV